MDPAIELTALLVMLAILAPAVLLLCCILEECPLKTKDTFEDLPLLCGVAANDCCTGGGSSPLCFAFVVGAVMFFMTASGMWLVAWRGAVMSSPGGASVTGTIS